MIFQCTGIWKPLKFNKEDAGTDKACWRRNQGVGTGRTESKLARRVIIWAWMAKKKNEHNDLYFREREIV